jgi:uncharacterized repeat protein (TIGR01451 family)
MCRNILLTKIRMMLIITIFITLIIPYAMTAHADPNIITFKADRALEAGDPHCQGAPGGLIDDIDGDGVADPGDTLGYAVCIVNIGNMDATNVDFIDTIDANTTLQGTFKTTPIARHDSYASIGNVGITVPAFSGVLVNDNDPDGTGPVSVVSFDATSANGGNVSVASDGSFTYDPAPGFEGNDSFNYTVQDSDGNLDPATVFISISDMIWFIDNSAAAGDGRLNSPFNSIAAFNAIQTGAIPGAKDGDVIFLHTGSGAYGDGLILRDSQHLFGQDIDLTIQLGLLFVTVPPFSDSLPTMGTRPVIAPGTGDGIQLASNNILRGFDVGNTPGGSGIVDDGSNAGTITIDTLAISGTGGGIEIDNGGSLAVTLDSLSASSSTDEGIHLASVSGFFTVSAGTISTTSVPGVDIDGTPSLALNVTLDSISASSTDGSTDGSGGIISTITNRGASFINTTGISLSNMTFSNASTSNGSTCTGLDNSGCNAAIHLESSTNIDLTNVDISTSAQQGINGLDVTDFTLADSTVTGCGNEVNEGCLRIVNLSGTASINNSNLSFPAERVAQIENTGVTLTLTVNNSTFRDTQSSGFGADGLEITSDGSSNTTIDIVNSNFLRNRTNGLQVFSEGTSFVNVDVTGSTFDRGTGIGIGMDLAADDSATLHFNVIGNPLINSMGSNSINVFSDGSATVQGRINDNPDIQVGGPGTAGLGIKVQANTNSNATVEIDGNTISNIGQDAGIQVISRLGGTGRLDATINDNDITVADPLGLYDIWVQANDSNTTCANVTNNTTSAAATAAFRVRTSAAASTVILQGSGATAAAVWSNNGNTPAAGPVSSSHNGTLTLGGTCNTVSHPMASLTPAGTKFFVNKEPESPSAVKEDRNFRDPLTSLVKPLAKILAGVDFTSFFSSIHENAAIVISSLADILGPSPAYASGEIINISFGDLNPGQQVTITFKVTVDTTIPPNVTLVCNQGIFESTNRPTCVSTKLI